MYYVCTSFPAVLETTLVYAMVFYLFDYDFTHQHYLIRGLKTR
jgi:preprotein translocase subunit SecE